MWSMDSSAFYSDLKVRQGKIDGYVKPLFHDMDVYDHRQDRDKSLFRKLYEGLVGGISALLTNRPREEVATRSRASPEISSRLKPAPGKQSSG